MSYKVTFLGQSHAAFGTPEIQPAKFYMSRAQAIHGMRRFAYARLEAFGKLDTQAAHDVMAAIDRADDILPPQDQHHITISNTGYAMILSNTARSPR
jgi:hypothetical protein